MHKSNKYEMYTDNNTLTFKTTSYRAEKTSVLHSGVYTKEFSSMLSASAASVLAYMVMDHMIEELKTARYFITIALFVTVFLGSRKFVFKDRYLVVNFNREKKTVTLIRNGILQSKTEKLSFDSIRSVEIGSRKFIPENIDGIDFVQKISAQHGSAVPGLSETEEFITLRLILTDGSERTIYAAKLNSGKVNGEPNIPVNEIRRFLDS